MGTNVIFLLVVKYLHPRIYDDPLLKCIGMNYAFFSPTQTHISSHVEGAGWGADRGKQALNYLPLFGSLSLSL